MLTLHQLPGRPDDWDQRIRNYHTKTLFHESAWLDHVLTIHPHGRIDYYSIHDAGNLVGYHCGLRVRKLGLPIHGSPLGGTGTNYMGPLVHADVDQRDLVRCLSTLVDPRRFLHMELGHYWLRPDILTEEGFQVHEGVTHLVHLPNEEEAAWRLLKSTARNRIRKAEKNGLTAERVHDPAIVQQYFAQYCEVYAKQHMRPPYTEERPRSLFAHLLPAERLLPLWIKYEGEILATGLFPYDEKCIYFWGAASWLKFQHLCPNELLHWHVIKFAVQQGIRAYNMCGGRSQFKDKFGGSDIPHISYSKSAFPLLQLARSWYRRRHFRRLRVRGG